MDGEEIKRETLLRVETLFEFLRLNSVISIDIPAFSGELSIRTTNKLPPKMRCILERFGCIYIEEE